MPRGGSREGAGRKTSWVSGCKFADTKLIRVPKAIADRLLQVAHKIDEGFEIEVVERSKDRPSDLVLIENRETLDSDKVVNPKEKPKKTGKHQTVIQLDLRDLNGGILGSTDGLKS